MPVLKDGRVITPPQRIYEWVCTMKLYVYSNFGVASYSLYYFSCSGTNRQLDIHNFQASEAWRTIVWVWKHKTAPKRTTRWRADALKCDSPQSGSSFTTFSFSTFHSLSRVPAKYTHPPTQREAYTIHIHTTNNGEWGLEHLQMTQPSSSVRGLRWSSDMLGILVQDSSTLLP